MMAKPFARSSRSRRPWSLTARQWWTSSCSCVKDAQGALPSTRSCGRCCPALAPEHRDLSNLASSLVGKVRRKMDRPYWDHEWRPSWTWACYTDPPNKTFDPRAVPRENFLVETGPGGMPLLPHRAWSITQGHRPLHLGYLNLQALLQLSLLQLLTPGCHCTLWTFRLEEPQGPPKNP